MPNKLIGINNHKLVKRPWGQYLILEKHPNYWLKKLFINKSEQLSLQSHKHRYEIWIVLSGKIRVQNGSVAKLILKPGEYLKINKNTKHRICGITAAVILEAAFGKPQEKDIIRYEDKYGRVK